jgi:hypothetical protein
MLCSFTHEMSCQASLWARSLGQVGLINPTIVVASNIDHLGIQRASLTHLACQAGNNIHVPVLDRVDYCSRQCRENRDVKNSPHGMRSASDELPDDYHGFSATDTSQPLTWRSKVLLDASTSSLKIRCSQSDDIAICGDPRVRLLIMSITVSSDWDG